MARIIIDHERLGEAIAADKDAGRRVIFTNGTFDLLHVGHVRSLTAAKALGDRLVVAVNSDDSVRRYKDPRLPITPEAERLEVLAALACIDYVTVFTEPTVDALLRLLQPHVHAKGTDYTRETVPERETVLAYGGEVAITGDPKGHASSSTIERIREIFSHPAHPEADG